jgi:hypothetical protein
MIICCACARKPPDDAADAAVEPADASVFALE